MVARPPLRLTIEAMRLEDLETVHQIELASFSAPWPANAYRSEIETNRLASYLVARAGDRIVAYGGMWLMVDEAHITTFAVHPDWRRQGVGRRLMHALLMVATEMRAARMTLEVRVSNLAAQALYRGHGFEIAGRRERYYTDDGEDAYIMSTAHLASPAMRPALEAARAAQEADE